MAQLRVYHNQNKGTRENYPYLLDIQSDLLEALRTTVVIPLMPERIARNFAMSRLNPMVEVGSERFAVMTQSLAGIDRTTLGDSVCDLDHYRAEIIGAIDFMLTGV